MTVAWGDILSAVPALAILVGGIMAYGALRQSAKDEKEARERFQSDVTGKLATIESRLTDIANVGHGYDKRILRLETLDGLDADDSPPGPSPRRNKRSRNRR